MNKLKRKNIITILLPTYNGERYLRELLDSIITQTYKNFILYIYDDGSTDSTCSIIIEYTKKYPFIKYELNETNNGHLYSFIHLISKVKSNFFAFCDQDDIWYPEKLNEYMKFLINENYNLIFSDSEIINENDNMISSSLHKFRNVSNFENVSITKSILRPFVAGHSMCGKTYLLKKMCKLKLSEKNQKLINYDTFVFSYYLLSGNIKYLDKTLTKYRLHKTNALGVKKPAMKNVISNNLTNTINYFKLKHLKRKIMIECLLKLNTYNIELKILNYFFKGPLVKKIFLSIPYLIFLVTRLKTLKISIYLNEIIVYLSSMRKI